MIIGYFLPPHASPQYNSRLFITILFTQMISDQRKITKSTKRQKTIWRETEQASEPASDMVGRLELSVQEFKTTVINAIKALVQSRQHARTDGQCLQRDGNS